MRLLLWLLLSTLDFAQAAFARQASGPLRVATYSLRFHTASDGADAWPNRKELVKNLVSTALSSTRRCSTASTTFS